METFAAKNIKYVENAENFFEADAEWKGALNEHNFQASGITEMNVNELQGSGCLYAFHHVAFYGNHEAVLWLLGIGADINLRLPMSFRTALHCAALRGNHQTVMLLLQKGAEPDLLDIYGCAPWQVAFFNGHVELAKVLYDVLPMQSSGFWGMFFPKSRFSRKQHHKNHKKHKNYDRYNNGNTSNTNNTGSDYSENLDHSDDKMTTRVRGAKKLLTDKVLQMWQRVA